jgi:hypothetical protein
MRVIEFTKNNVVFYIYYNNATNEIISMIENVDGTPKSYCNLGTPGGIFNALEKVFLANDYLETAYNDGEKL